MTNRITGQELAVLVLANARRAFGPNEDLLFLSLERLEQIKAEAESRAWRRLTSFETAFVQRKRDSVSDIAMEIVLDTGHRDRYLLEIKERIQCSLNIALSSPNYDVVCEQYERLDNLLQLAEQLGEMFPETRNQLEIVWSRIS